MERSVLTERVDSTVPLRQVEQGIYSVYPKGRGLNAYDRDGALAFYDRVACNRFYNRVMWGYWPSVFDRLCRRVLAEAREGLVLDAGCGSLAFTARAHAGNHARPVIFLDQSLTLLRLAKKRLTAHLGRLPESVLFLHADALSLPFALGTFTAVMAFNLLHAVADGQRLVSELVRVARPDAAVAVTTLARSGRWSDRYLELWGRKGELVPRSRAEVLALFAGAGQNVSSEQTGNMLVVEKRRA